MKYTDLDYAAYDLYVKAVEKNPYRSDSFDFEHFGGINDSFVGYIDEFVEWRSRHDNNMKLYYDNANIKMRKQKLKKLKKL
jgi:hypothetical protein